VATPNAFTHLSVSSGGFAKGAQSKKVVAVIDGQIMLPVGGAASTHIIKPASDRLTASVENELLCMRLAAALGIPTAEVSYGEAEGGPYLLVRRYDRSIGDDGMVRRSH
jgi:serine/threonine-protein kinase HipA